MLKISYAGCLGPAVISTKFAFEICVADQNRKKNSLKPSFRVHGRSRSSILVPPESSSRQSPALHSIGQSIKSFERPCVRASVQHLRLHRAYYLHNGAR